MSKEKILVKIFDVGENADRFFSITEEQLKFLTALSKTNLDITTLEVIEETPYLAEKD